MLSRVVGCLACEFLPSEVQLCNLCRIARSLRRRVGLIAFAIATAGIATAAADMALADSDLRVAVHADWARQEKRAGRERGSRAAIRAAIDRSARLLANLATLY